MNIIKHGEILANLSYNEQNDINKNPVLVLSSGFYPLNVQQDILSCKKSFIISK